MKLIVDGLVKMKNRDALLEMREHRQRLRSVNCLKSWRGVRPQPVNKHDGQRSHRDRGRSRNAAMIFVGGFIT